MKRIAIIGYGNLHSIHRALATVAGDEAEVAVVTDRASVAAADRVVFPGQGAARDCMEGLATDDLTDAVVTATKEKPFLGICMGLQILMEHSEEDGGTPCLGLLKGTVRRFREEAGDDKPRRKIPHMGWNRVKRRGNHPLWRGIGDDSHFYFAHSYYTAPDDERAVAGTTEYGENFTSVVSDGPVFAVQFHPEKSAASGLRLLHNFVHWDGRL